ncbi:MAG: FAD-linked oxidase C-terminal domain-containing protein [Salibaculum sp.]|uniref:FAD-binding oxidoreductase n=1 Tax=Salibaculum sp. TaxID=2855480 RepID=UPI002870AEC5|nr:FAD-linked oxidase C-terminal domain-containing protein [Salibaculum sp.]MDR9428876.1 FAD-linked oxidase C-terminal domain-containing protein [Salibaculum sp.]MDR9481877.1 FAD-linked oxidase C-terminal domain-containing protein [Salibaculum sp.]
MPHDAAFTALETVLGDRLSRSKPDLEAHGTSETHFPHSPPDAVAYPETSEEVAQIMQICAAHRLPVVGWGAGTSLEGHALAVHGGVCVDFARMTRVLEVRDADMVARVQPGLTREGLNAELRATGLFFPVDPGANASIGGMAATRASGTTAVRYGTMRDNVLALEVVLADGRIIRTGSAAPKSSAGYDLTGLMVGSEGTLGVITELTLRLHGQPEAIGAATCAFDTIEAAVEAVTETIQMGLPMARIEFVDAATVEAVNAYSRADFPAKPHLMVEFHGTPAGVAEQAERFGEIVADHGATGFAWADRPEDRTRLWQMRHHAYWAILAARPGTTAIVTDVCVPISELAQAVAETQADIAAAPIPAPILGHVGDGNFHAILLMDPDAPAERAAAENLSRRMAERALRLGGTVTGEHGIGMGKLGYMAAEHGAGWEVMGTLKQALDPQGLLNPGKLLRQD